MSHLSFDVLTYLRLSAVTKASYKSSTKKGTSILQATSCQYHQDFVNLLRETANKPILRLVEIIFTTLWICEPRSGRRSRSFTLGDVSAAIPSLKWPDLRSFEHVLFSVMTRSCLPQCKNSR